MHACGGVAQVRHAHQLRVNSYRVLLTRGREASVIFVLAVGEIDETAKYLLVSGIPALLRAEFSTTCPGLKPLLGHGALRIHAQKHHCYISTRNLTVAIKISKQIIAELAELQK